MLLNIGEYQLWFYASALEPGEGPFGVTRRPAQLSVTFPAENAASASFIADALWPALACVLKVRSDNALGPYLTKAGSESKLDWRPKTFVA